MEWRKKWYLLFCTCFLLAGCKASGSDNDIAGGYQVYYINNSQTGVVTQNYSAKSNTTEKLVAELLKKLEQPTNTIEYICAKPTNVKLLDYSLEGEILHLQFNAEYMQMERAAEVLMRMAYVKTLVQVSGISYLKFYVNEQPLLNSNGVAIGAMNDETFVQNDGSTINEYVTTEFILYFSDNEGKELVQSPRRVTHSTNMSLERVVMEQLLKGPSSNEGVQATLPKDTKLVSISTKDGVCYVSLSSEFLNLSNTVSAEMQIYSIVNSLAELATVSKVQISVDGSANTPLALNISLEQPFERNLDLVQSGGK